MVIVLHSWTRSKTHIHNTGSCPYTNIHTHFIKVWSVQSRVFAEGDEKQYHSAGQHEFLIVSLCVYEGVCPPRLMGFKGAGHRCCHTCMCKIKAIRPVNDEQAGFYLRANSQQVEATTPVPSQYPSALYYDLLTLFLHFFFPLDAPLSFTPYHTINYSLSHLPRFPHSALSLSISPALIQFPSCCDPRSSDSVVHSSTHRTSFCLSVHLLHFPLSVSRALSARSLGISLLTLTMYYYLALLHYSVRHNHPLSYS